MLRVDSRFHVATQPFADPEDTQQDCEISYSHIARGIPTGKLGTLLPMRERPEEEPAPEPEPQTNSRRRRRGQAEASGYASDELDEPATPAKKRKLTKAQEAKEKAKAKKAAKKQGDDDSDEDEGNDLYTALSGMRGGGKPPVGSFSNCARCEKQFTVVRNALTSMGACC